MTKTIFFTIGLFLFWSPGYINITQASNVPPVFHTEVKPLTPLGKDIPVTFSLKYSLDTMLYHVGGDTGSVTIKFYPLREPSNILHEEHHKVQYDETYSHQLEFQISIPDNNVFALFFELVCGKATWYQVFFISTVGDTAEYSIELHHLTMPREYFELYHLPMPREYNESAIQNSPDDPDRDTLTQEQLSAVREIGVDLRKQEDFEYAQKLLGSIPDSCAVPGKKGLYIIRITLDQLLRLSDYGIDLDSIDKQPSPSSPQETDDDTQGSIIHHRNAPVGLSLDSVSNLTPSGVVSK